MFRSSLIKQNPKSPSPHPTSSSSSSSSSSGLSISLNSPLFKRSSPVKIDNKKKPYGLSPIHSPDGPPHLEQSFSPPTPTNHLEKKSFDDDERRDSIISNRSVTAEDTQTDKEGGRGGGISSGTGSGIGSLRGSDLSRLRSRSRDTSVDRWERPSLPPVTPRSGAAADLWEPPTPPPHDTLPRKAIPPKLGELLSFSSLLSVVPTTPKNNEYPNDTISPTRSRGRPIKSTWERTEPPLPRLDPEQSESEAEDGKRPRRTFPRLPIPPTPPSAHNSHHPSISSSTQQKKISASEVETPRDSYLSAVVADDEGGDTGPSQNTSMHRNRMEYQLRIPSSQPPSLPLPHPPLGGQARRMSTESTDSSTVGSEHEPFRRGADRAPVNESTENAHLEFSENEMHQASQADLDTQTGTDGGGDGVRRRGRDPLERKSETWGESERPPTFPSYAQESKEMTSPESFKPQISSFALSGLYSSAAGGWKTTFDPASGRWYWYNKATGERTWEDPAGPSDQDPLGEVDDGPPDQDAPPQAISENKFEAPRQIQDDEMSVAESVLPSHQLKVHIDKTALELTQRPETPVSVSELDDIVADEITPRKFDTTIAADSRGGIKLRLTPVSRVRRDSDLSSIESREDSQFNQKRGWPLLGREVPTTGFTRRKLEHEPSDGSELPSPVLPSPVLTSRSIPSRNEDDPVRLRLSTPTPSQISMDDDEKHQPQYRTPNGIPAGPGFRGKIVDRTPSHKAQVHNNNFEPEISQNQEESKIQPEISQNQLQQQQQPPPFSDPYPKKPTPQTTSRREVDSQRMKVEEEKQGQLQKKKIRGLHDSQVRRVLRDLEAEEVELGEEAPDFRFSTHRMGNWFQRLTRTGEIRDGNRILSFQNDLIYKSILKKNRGLDKQSAACFKRIQGYMGDRKTSKLQLILAQKLLGKLLTGKPGLREEAYLQLCKQVTENPNPSSCIKGWELMIFFLATFPPPSPFLEKFLNDFIHNTCQVCTHQDVLKLANVCEQRINTIITLGARKQVPSAEELTKLQGCNPCSISVFLLNGAEEKCNVDSYTLVSDVEDILVQTRKIVMSPSPFALYEAVTDTPGVERVLVGKDRILDILAAWEHRENVFNKKLKAQAQVPTRIPQSPSTTGPPTLPQSKLFKLKPPKFNRLLFKAKLLVKVQESRELLADPEAIELFFHQACHEVSTGRYLCKNEDITTLAALQIHATYGPSRANPSFSDPRVVGPLIQQFVGPSFQNVPELESKTRRKYELFEERDEKEVTDGESKLRRVVHLSEMDAKINYLDFVNRYPLYGACFFMAEQFQWKDAYPCQLVIAVSTDGFALLDPSNKENNKVLERHGYDELSTWGCLEEKFVIVVGNVVDQRKFIFFTPYAWEIDDLLTSYVNFKLKDSGVKKSSRPMTPQSQSRSHQTPRPMTPVLEK